MSPSENAAVGCANGSVFMTSDEVPGRSGLGNA